MSTNENEIDEILFNQHDDDEACIGSVLVLRNDCTTTTNLSLLELLAKGLAEVLADMGNPKESTEPAECQEMSDYAHEAFAAGKAVTISLTLMPEDVLLGRADAHDADVGEDDTGDDGRLLN